MSPKMKACGASIRRWHDVAMSAAELRLKLGYGSIPIHTIFRDEHPFTSYFDVHQGDRVLTHPHF